MEISLKIQSICGKNGRKKPYRVSSSPITFCTCQEEKQIKKKMKTRRKKQNGNKYLLSFFFNSETDMAKFHPTESVDGVEAAQVF